MELCDINKLNSQICTAVQSSPYGKRLVQTISDRFGPRAPGSKAIRDACEFIAQELKVIGAKNIHTEDVPVLAWRQGNCAVELLSPRSAVYDSFQHVHSASVCLEAPLLDGGTGSEEQLDRFDEKIKGAVLLVCGSQVSGQKYIPFRKVLLNARDRGAAAVLVRNMYPGTGPLVELAGILEDIDIGVVGLSSEDADELASFAKSTEPVVRIETISSSFQTDCINLIAEMGPANDVSDVIENFYSKK